ncbi:MAG: type VI secretion system baseplate subunit TssE [Rhodospirillaceae bacterium]
MAGPCITVGVRVPLFDRLVATAAAGEMSGAGHDRRMLDRAGLKASIGRELERLLNTRSPLAVEALSKRPRSTLDYGLPDLSRFWPANTESEAELARLIERTVMAFEPRLHKPRVSVERIPGRQRALRAVVAGSIALDNMVEPVSFPVAIDDSAERQADE